MGDTQTQITVQWTRLARDHLAQLPYKVKQGLLDKADELRTADDPRQIGKPLRGPLSGFYRIAYSRYRAIYHVSEQQTSDGQPVLRITIRFVLAGQRKEGDKRDVYRLAKQLIKVGRLAEGESNRSEQ